MASVHHVGLNAGIGPSAEQKLWCLHGRIDWREWDGECVARVDGTAATLLISALAGEVLDALRAGSASAEEIATRVFGGSAGVTARSTLVARFAEAPAEAHGLLQVLTALEAKGLVRADRA